MSCRRPQPYEKAWAFVLSTLACVSIVVTSDAAYTPGGGLLGSPHDLRGTRYAAAAEDGACNYCHAGHDNLTLNEANGGPAPDSIRTQAAEEFDYLPLWTHELTQNARVFATYQNGSGAPRTGAHASQAAMDGSLPGSVSLLCLSCHDGSVAVNSYGNFEHRTGGTTIGSQYLIGADAVLSNHHPIGLDYDAVRSLDDQIRPADAASLGGAGPVRAHLFGPGNSRMECSTCHSVHNTGNTGENLLWRSDARSRLCLSCHDKGDDPGTAIP